MLNLGSSGNEAAWAVGGVLVTLVSHLIKSFEEVLEQSRAETCFDAERDIKEIQARFNRFISQMLQDDKNH